MKTTHPLFTTLLAFGSVAAITVGQPTRATAGGFSTARFGGEDGTATSDSVTSLWYNPSGIALADGTNVYVEGLFAYRTVDYNRDRGTIDNEGTGTPSDAIASNTGHAHLANPILSPFAGVSTDFGKKKGYAIGLGLFVPYGGQAKWDENSKYANNATYPGAVDGQQRWAVIEGQQRSIYITAGGAYATPSKQLAVGVGLNLILTDVSLDRARNALGTDDVVSEGNALLEVKNTTFGLGIGVQWRPTDKLRLGAAYQSQPGFGQMELGGKLTTKFGSSDPIVTDVVLLQRMPDTARIAAEIQASPAVVVRLGAEWQNWSVFQDQCLVTEADPSRRCAFNPDGSIDTDDPGAAQTVVVNLPRNYKDGWNVKVGGAWHDQAKVTEVAASLMYDANVVPDETMDPSLFDMGKVIAQGTVRRALGDKLSLHLTVGNVFYAKRTTEPRAADPQAPSRNPDMAGTYVQHVFFAALGVGIHL